MDVVLEECNELNDFSFMMKDVKYPCVVIDGITSNDEIEFLETEVKKRIAAWQLIWW